MKKLLMLIPACGLFAMISCSPKKQPELTNQDVSKVVGHMTSVMIHDVTNPPLAARFFAYTCLAGYEVVAENDKQTNSMRGVLNQYPDIKHPKQNTGYNYQLSAVLAMFETSARLLPSGTLMLGYESSFIDSCKNIGFSSEVIDSSKSYAKTISKQILAYAKADGYRKINNYPRYKLKQTPGSWDLTPPAYMLPVEPYFNTIRPMTLDSAAQFVPDAPIPFSTDKNSTFYKYLQMSYAKSGNGLKQEEKDIANFWDCNPFAVQNDGHMLIGLKKISPGAHWMGITAIACKQAKVNFSKTVQINTAVAIGLLDGFICCWEDKYRTNRIRPETAIRRYIDPHWKPLLQTPPFPEYISGHSVVSSTAAVILTHYFGDNFKYTDDVEVSYGIPPRHFSSFTQAAKEAAISRFWGGIHFMDAIDNGIIQGNKVGNLVVAKMSGQKKS
ncbi:vanadium-dependent haloperoxidase [Mucilaginibacter gossypii]|uniref:vanadium-dependent haloperoxidase n=1 Tax=Mucilaginibacter gossypii TaxID=551996 RepID=UPI000DCEA7E5|nr:MULTISPECIES: vanadium-dependent haloperoxidase [Mucilaginibacter]QTE36459.1 vanadium-dependent haloperoxidase [Mucilaginibacter gossypii]RAV48618.1 haloperoxidase [Mucilaginibacter rubeus]